MKTTTYILLGLTVALLALSCGSPKETDTQSLADMLPADIDSLGLSRTSEVRVFVGDSLYEYIDGGAELYHQYDFVQVATADYQKDGVELVVDIYEFASPDRAFGLYTMLRPEMIQTIPLGVEAFDSPTNLIMVKGAYVVMVTAYEQGEGVSAAIMATAGLMDNLVAGVVSRPEIFALFPDENMLVATEAIYAESFMGQAVLTNVYSRKYAVESDTLQLFITDDESGVKFLGWKEQAEANGALSEPPAGINFDDGMAFRFGHDYYGEILAGLKIGRLQGVIGYRDGVKDFVADWVNSPMSATP